MNNKIVFSLAALVVGVVIGIFLPTAGLGLDKSEVQDIVNQRLIGQEGVEVEVSDVKNFGNISELTLNFDGQEDSIYVSDNGKVYFQKIVDVAEIEAAEQASAAAQVVETKSDKPEVELFVMSYCPFGTQMEKGLLPVEELLGDKIDSKIKFVNYIMHPTYGEGEENLLQYCIQKEMPEQFNDYLGCFLEAGDQESCLNKTGIVKSNLNTCITATDNEFSVTKYLNDKETYLNGTYPQFKVDDADVQAYGITGSPTLVVNGQVIDGAGRDANSILQVVCSAFNEAPEECNTALSSETPSTGFGYDVTTDTTTAGCGA